MTTVRESAEKLVQQLIEMPVISKHGKTVYADERPLKSVPTIDVQDNIVVIYNKEATFFTPAGFFWAYFMDSDESAEAMKSGKLAYKFIHDRTGFSQSAPITDIWKGKQDKGEGHKNILGLLQGQVTDTEIYIDKMSVRSSFQRNTINSKMVDAVKTYWPDLPVNWSGPTKNGSNFIKKYTGQPWSPAHGETAETG